MISYQPAKSHGGNGIRGVVGTNLCTDGILHGRSRTHGGKLSSDAGETEGVSSQHSGQYLRMYVGETVLG